MPPASSPSSLTEVPPLDHPHYLALALSEARHSPRLPSNFRVGALLVDPASGDILSTGFTNELPGNTHAEQCALHKLAAAADLPPGSVRNALPEGGVVLYTTVEPCVERLSGKGSCVGRIVEAGRVRWVVTGVREPGTFVRENMGEAVLREAGVRVLHVPGMEDEILEVAMAGHEKGEK